MVRGDSDAGNVRREISAPRNDVPCCRPGRRITSNACCPSINAAVNAACPWPMAEVTPMPVMTGAPSGQPGMQQQRQLADVGRSKRLDPRNVQR